MFTIVQKLINFGPKLMFWQLLFHYRKRFPRYKSVICKHKHKCINERLLKSLSFDFTHYKHVPKSTKAENAIIWLCWWDGENTLPPIVKMCIKSIVNHSARYKVIVLCKDNFQDHLDLPPLILEKFRTGVIPIQQFIDVLRIFLLQQEGGLWLDATMLASADIEEEPLASLFSLKHGHNSDFVSNGRWAVYCIGGEKNHALFRFVADAFIQYFRKYDVLIDYFLFDHFIDIAYQYIPSIKAEIDNIPLNNPKVTALQRKLNESFIQQDFDHILANTKLHKLNWRFKEVIANPPKQSYFDYLKQHFN